MNWSIINTRIGEPDIVNTKKHLFHTLMAFNGVTNAHGPSPQPTACKSPSCSLTTAKGSNQAQGNLIQQI